MIATNVPQFHEMCKMPLAVDTARLNEGDGMEATLRRNAAKYHTSCRAMFNNTKLERVRKEHSGVQSESEGQAKHRRTGHYIEACTMCERIARALDLRQVMTINVSDRLNDDNILAK